MEVIFEGCFPNTDPIENCTTPQPVNSNDNGMFNFAFWDCFTPVITDISPNQGEPDAVITLTGYGFGTETCQNEITINDYNCDPQSANETHVQCVIDTEDTFPVGRYDTVYMNVFGKGDAINAVTSPVGRTFRMIPHITGLSQSEGSTEGGTYLVIYGDGFSAETIDDISVTIGGGECVVASVEYTSVACVTSKPDSPGRYQPVITINNVNAVCAAGRNCNFTFDSESTPTVSSVSPDTVSGASTTITIEGSGFGNTSTITIGGVECEVISEAEDSIECDVGYVPVGDAPLIVNIDGAGNAVFENPSHATLYSSEVIDSVNPTSGSIEGGQEVTIVGSGFRDGDTSVEIDGSECIIQSIDLSQIVCITTSHSAEAVEVDVTSGGISYPGEDYEYADADTPIVSSVTPSSGISGDSIAIGGSGFSTTDSENTVTIDGVECSVTSSGASSIECDVGIHSAGTYVIVVHVQAKGYATSSTEFEYSLEIDSASPSQGMYFVVVC